jgi:hypothetical protein
MRWGSRIGADLAEQVLAVRAACLTFLDPREFIGRDATSSRRAVAFGDPPPRFSHEVVRHRHYGRKQNDDGNPDPENRRRSVHVNSSSRCCGWVVRALVDGCCMVGGAYGQWGVKECM